MDNDTIRKHNRRNIREQVMSFRNIRHIYGTEIGNANAKSVLLCINHFINEKTGRAFPSVSTIAKYTELNQRTIYRALKYLVENKFLKKIKTPNAVNQYELLTVCHVTTDTESHYHTNNIVNTKRGKNESSNSIKSKAEITRINQTQNYFASRGNRKSSFFAKAYTSLKNRGAS